MCALRLFARGVFSVTWIAPFAVASLLAAPAPVPADEPSPPPAAGLSSPAPATPLRPLLLKRREPLIVLDVRPTQSFPLSADERSLPGQPTDNEIVLDGDLFIALKPHLHAFIKYDNPAEIDGATYKNGVRTYPGYNRDERTSEGFSWDFPHGLALDVGHRERHRTCCPGAGDPTVAAKRFYTATYAGVTYVFGPNSMIGKPFRVYAEEMFVNHHHDIGVPIPPGPYDEGKKTVFQYWMRGQFELFGQQKVVPYIEYQNFTGFFAMDVVPAHTSRTFTGLRINASKLLAYDVHIQNDHNYAPTPNSGHNVSLYVDAIFKYVSDF